MASPELWTSLGRGCPGWLDTARKLLGMSGPDRRAQLGFGRSEQLVLSGSR